MPAGPTAPNARVVPITAEPCTSEGTVPTGGAGGAATGATDGGGGITPDDSEPEGGVGCGTKEPDAVVEPANRFVDFRPEVLSLPKTCVDDCAPVRSPPPAGGIFGAGAMTPVGDALNTW